MVLHTVMSVTPLPLCGRESTLPKLITAIRCISRGVDALFGGKAHVGLAQRAGGDGHPAGRGADERREGVDGDGKRHERPSAGAGHRVVRARQAGIAAITPPRPTTPPAPSTG
ncbi:MAG: hypothetical protein N3G20_11410, partial [Verrucomicrobiae bacterium]|nr:hypothetical protein [Verrucomicrobiae bacterium]